jgi:hypothetical protein
MCARGVYIDRTYLEWGIKRMYEVMAEARSAIPWLSDTRLEVYPRGEARCVDSEGRIAVADSKGDKEAYLAILGLPAPPNYDYNKPDILWWNETKGPDGRTYEEIAPAIAQVRRFKRANIKLVKMLKLRAWLKPDGRVSLDIMYMGVGHTGRWKAKTLEGEEEVSGVNLQNFDNEGFEGFVMRRLIVPAPGNKFIDCDASAIEPRILARLSGQWKVIAALRKGFNIYEASALAWRTWAGEPNTFKTGDPKRYKGTKIAVLGCGYRVGADKLRRNVRVREGRDISPQEALDIVVAYRRNNPEVVAFWARWDKEIRAAWASHIPRTLVVTLASGRKLVYSDIEKIPDQSAPWKQDFRGWVGGQRRKLYGGSVTENIVQSTARDAFGIMILVAEERGFVPVMLVHDELLAEVAADSPLTKEDLEAIFRLPIPWLPGLPLGAEGRSCMSYADSPDKDNSMAVVPVPETEPDLSRVYFREARFTKTAKAKRRQSTKESPYRKPPRQQDKTAAVVML